mmetsp:Transcript_14518/g.17605  ORF Transcript_14518/g.17605 Transcript_14518/m.17605 type:complete len:92 (+) Transcript_14518:247-522(+)
MFQGKDTELNLRVKVGECSASSAYELRSIKQSLSRIHIGINASLSAWVGSKFAIKSYGKATPQRKRKPGFRKAERLGGFTTASSLLLLYFL